MFEKEAEDNKPPYAFCAFNTKCELWKDGFQKGAEFGYNKCDEQLIKAKELLEKLLEEEKNNMYWEMNGSDKSSYYEVRKQAEQFLNSEVEK